MPENFQQASLEIILLQDILKSLRQMVTIAEADSLVEKSINRTLISVAGTLESVDATLKQILTAVEPPKPAALTSIQFVFNPITGEEKMPLQLPDTQSDTYSIIGTDALGVLGASLGAGQTVTVVSSDPATVLLTPDASPLPVPAGETAPAGTPTIASGVVASAQPPVQPNVPISVTATVLNADGTTAATVTDTVTIIPGALASVGELFGPTTPLASSKFKPATPGRKF